jgi:hypothetical protein
MTTPIEKMPDFFCRACRRGIDAGNWFCGYCGTYFVARQHRLLRYDGVYVTPPKREKGLFIRHYFRFYPDDFVIGIIFAGRNDNVATSTGVFSVYTCF